MGCLPCDKTYGIDRNSEFHHNNRSFVNKINNNVEDNIFNKFQELSNDISKNEEINLSREINEDNQNIEEKSNEELKNHKKNNNIKNKKRGNNKYKINQEDSRSEAQKNKYKINENQSNNSKNSIFKKRNTYNKISLIKDEKNIDEKIKHKASINNNKKLTKNNQKNDVDRKSNYSQNKTQEIFYFFDDYTYLKDIKKYNSSNRENEIFILYYQDKNNDFKPGYYKKKDFSEKYKFINICYQKTTFNIILVENKYKSSEKIENNILKELDKPLCRKKIEEKFNISGNKKLSLNKINNKGNKFNLIIEEIKDKNDENSFNEKLDNKDNNDNDENNNQNDNKKQLINIKGDNISENKSLNKADNVASLKEINKITIYKNNIKSNKDNKDNNMIINDINTKENSENQNKINSNKNNGNKIINIQINNNIININNNNNINNQNQINNNYFFPLVGLKNVGSTCFMNAILQFLIHVPELSLYFLNEYQNDKQLLKSKNPHSLSKGDLSEAYYIVVKGVKDNSEEKTFKYNSYNPKQFKEVLGKYNPQFSRYEANDSKDLILYLLQTFHEELNYFGDKTAPTNIQPPNQTLRYNAYNYFNLVYSTTNFSKISQLFYGTYENIIKCVECKNSFYSYQKFEYISFSTYSYKNKKFDIMKGFEHIESKQELKGDNQYNCIICNKMVDASLISKIIDLPKYLILNIDYGKNKVNEVKQLQFEEEIDLQKFISFYCGQKTKYKLVAVCTHIGSSGPTGHYIAFCLDKINKIWYKFDDSTCKKADKYELNNNSPYLLLYEIIL